MICILKHKKTDKYIVGVVGRMTQTPNVWDLHGNVFQVKREWNKDKKVQFRLTTDMLQARKVEDPDMDMVLAFGLEAIPVKLEKAILKQDYRILEHE